MFIEKHIVNIFYLSIYVGFYPKFLVHNSLSKTGHRTRISFPQAESQKFQYSPALELQTTKNFSDLPYLKEDGKGVLLQQQSYSIFKRKKCYMHRPDSKQTGLPGIQHQVHQRYMLPFFSNDIENCCSCFSSCLCSEVSIKIPQRQALKSLRMAEDMEVPGGWHI